MEENIQTAPGMVRRPTRKRRADGRTDIYESLIIAGQKLDRRTAPARLFRHVEDAIHAELGGRDGLTVAQLSLARRAASLVVQAELAERALLEGGEPDLAAYRATCAELRRVLESLGLSRGQAEAPAAPGGAYAAALAEAEEADRGR